MRQSYSTYTDAQLADLLKMGDEAAFANIYNRYWQKLFFIAHKRLQSAEDTKEIIQEVFLNLWHKRETLQIQSLPVYLASMTRYAVYRHWANKNRRASYLKVVDTGSELLSPAIDIDNKQFLDILTRFADTLPQKYRLIFIHHKLLDRPLEEVAKELGVSPRTAERYVTKVLEIMRKHRKEVALVISISFFS